MIRHPIESNFSTSKEGNGPSVSFREAFRTWCRVAALSFGGPAGQIAVMHRILVEEKKWISESRFLHALNYCMLLPGPEAQQLSVYIGWLLHGTAGGLMAGTLFVLPGFVSILILSILYASYHDLSIVQALFFGLKPAVVAVVVSAVIRIGLRALKNIVMVAFAATAFLAIFFFQVPFPLIIAAAGLIGFIGGIVWPQYFVVIQGHGSKDNSAEHVISEVHVNRVKPTIGRAARVAAIWLSLWFGPILLLAIFTGLQSVYTTEAIFFSKTAIITFGGAYAVLSYIAQECVKTYGWLQPGEMLDGLGMAETTPGPLIQVVQFVAFLGAYRNPGALSPLAAGLLGSAIATWVTYTPCFLWIFLGAPYIESLRGRKTLSAALSTITAAVVGVILNLSIWFSLHTLFGKVTERQFYGVRILAPDWATLDVVPAALAIGAFVAMFRFKVGMLPTIAVSTGLGLLYFLLVRA